MAGWIIVLIKSHNVSPATYYLKLYEKLLVLLAVLRTENIKFPFGCSKYRFDDLEEFLFLKVVPGT
jgi:hypothetical protein